MKMGVHDRTITKELIDATVSAIRRTLNLFFTFSQLIPVRTNPITPCHRSYRLG
jgi:hypothetical protein